MSKYKLLFLFLIFSFICSCKDEIKKNEIAPKIDVPKQSKNKNSKLIFKKNLKEKPKLF